MGLGISTASVCARAEEENEISLSLVLPKSNQEYLSLKSPSSISHSGEDFVVTDGSELYYYSKEFGAYQKFSHTYNSESRLNEIEQASFGSDGNVYFTDTTNFLYRLNPKTGEIVRTDVNCSTFALDGDDFYYATSSRGRVTIAKTDLSLQSVEILLQYAGTAAPALAAKEGRAYYAEKNVLRELNSGEGVLLPVEEDALIFSLSASESGFSFVTLDGALHFYDTLSPDSSQSVTGEYYAVECVGEFAYAVNGSRVEQFTLADGKKTTYEISAASPSEGRLTSGSDVCMVESELLIADSSTRCVTTLSEGNFSYFLAEGIPYEISADEESVLVNSGSSFSIYDKKGNLLYASEPLSGGETFVSSVNVYGVYYLITASNAFCKIERSDSGEYSFERVAKSLPSTAKELSSDLMGNVYCYFSNNSVSRFSESDFMDSSSIGASAGRFSKEITSFRAAYDGTLYGLSGDSILTSEGDEYPLSYRSAVYGTSEKAVAFAFGSFEPTLYLLCPTYLTQTDLIPIPNLNSISFGDAGEKIFEKESVPLSVVEVQKGSVLSSFDLTKMPTSKVFTYLGSKRSEEKKQGILLGETKDYTLVALFNEETHRYEANFVSPADCVAVESSLVLQPSSAFANATAYTSNQVELLKYPFFLSSELTLASLPRGKKVSVQGELSLNEGQDFSYAYVEVETGEKTLQGYLPASFLIATADTKESYEYLSTGYLNTEEKTILMTSDSGAKKNFSTDLLFTIIGDPYAEKEVTISYREADGTTYYAAVSSDVFRTNKQKNLRKYVIGVLGVVAIILVTDYFLLKRKREPDFTDEDDDD